MKRIALLGVGENPYITMLFEGIEKSGDQPVAVRDHDCLQGFDAACCWSMKKYTFLNKVRQAKCPVLVAECGYLGDRTGDHRALGWNGINGEADFCNAQVPSDRMQEWLPQMKPWKTSGEYILLCGQVLGDYTLRRLHKKLSVFYAYLAKQLMEAYNLPVIFRPHPLYDCKDMPSWVERSVNKSIQDDLKKAWLTVAWSSNALVDATMAGCPTLCFDPIAMTWDLSIHQVGQTPRLPDRHTWLNKLSYAQWTNDEFRNGTAWKHVRQYLENQNAVLPVGGSSSE